MTDDINNALRLAHANGGTGSSRLDLLQDMMSRDKERRRQESLEKEIPEFDDRRYIAPEEYHRGTLHDGKYALASGGRAGYALGGQPTGTVDPNASYVSSLYQNVLGRAADEAGSKFWADQLGSGAIDQATMLENFAQSPEFQNLYSTNPNKAISSLYQEALGRAPDQAGLDFWQQQAKGGLDLSQMTKNFLGSQEGQNVQDINQYYQDITGQVATPEQMQQAMNALGSNQDWANFAKTAFPDQNPYSDAYDVAGGWQSRATEVPTASADLMAKLGPIEQKYNLPPGYLMGMMGIESGYGTNQQRAGSGFSGAFQLSKALRDQFGVTNPYDWEQSADAAAQFAVQNREAFRNAVGRDPTAAELYGLHQQGPGGFSAIAKRPDISAAEALVQGAPSAYRSLSKARNAIRQNLPGDLRGQAGTMSSRDFMDFYGKKFNEKLYGPDQLGQQAIADYYAAHPSVQQASFTPPGTNVTTQPFLGENIGQVLATQGAGGNVYTGTIPGTLSFPSPGINPPGTTPDWQQPSTTMWQPPTTNTGGTFISPGGAIPGTGMPSWDYSTGLTVNSPAFVGSTPGMSGYNPIPSTPGVSFFKNGGAVEDALRIARASGGGAWTRKEGKNPNGGLNEKGRASLRAQGHDIKRPQPEGGARRDSFCARMKGMKEKLTSAKTANDPDSRINKSLRAWNCREDGGKIEMPPIDIPAKEKEYYEYGMLPLREDEAGTHFDSNAGILGSIQKALKSAYSGATLPGDVVAGKVDPMSDEGIRRAVELAGTMTLGSGAGEAPADSLRSGLIRAYHGSPHKFDKFDLAKIGTGEGAQAYGHGLYFAESEPVARAYREALAGKDTIPAINAEMSKLSKIMDEYAIPGKYRQYNDPVGYEAAKRYDALMDARANEKGHMYEVNIHADPEHFLDWDKLASEQPDAVRDAFMKMDKTVDVHGTQHTPHEPYETVGDWFKHHARHVGQDKITDRMREAGIPGIKYLDQGSRGAGEGSRNYVVFDPEMLEILRRYKRGGEVGYPERDRKDWHISHDYESRHGKMKYLSPDEFLDRSRPLHKDSDTLSSIDNFKHQIEHGDKLDPLQLLANGLEDGRHRAAAAKELGIDKVPVIDFRADGGDVVSALRIAKGRKS